MKHLIPVTLFFFKDLDKAPDLLVSIGFILLWALFLMFASFSYIQHRENEELKAQNKTLLAKLGRI